MACSAIVCAIAIPIAVNSKSNPSGPAGSQYHLYVGANPVSGGTVTGAGDCKYNQSVTISASALPGYSFEGWYVNGISLVSNDVTYSFICLHTMLFIKHIFLLQ